MIYWLTFSDKLWKMFCLVFKKSVNLMLKTIELS